MSKRASVTIEAALVMPFVLYSIIVLYGLIGYLHFDYQLSRAATTAALDFSYDSYLLNHLQAADILAHYTYQRQSLKPAEITELQQKLGDLQAQTVFDLTAQEGMLKDFREMIELSQSMIGKIAKLPEELPGIGRSEATIFVSRMIFGKYFKHKISQSLKQYLDFNESRLQIKAGQYLYDFKASVFYVVYSYQFPLRFPFLKDAQIVQPIYIESYVGNIRRYQGQKYGKKEKEKMAEEMVYITEKGKVYHTDAKCFVIYAEPKQVEKNGLKSCKPCEICQKKGKNFGSQVYKTDKSKIFHADLTCSAIHHQIREIPLAEAEKEREKCKHCRKQEED